MSSPRSPVDARTSRPPKHRSPLPIRQSNSNIQTGARETVTRRVRAARELIQAYVTPRRVGKPCRASAGKARRASAGGHAAPARGVDARAGPEAPERDCEPRRVSRAWLGASHALLVVLRFARTGVVRRMAKAHRDGRVRSVQTEPRRRTCGSKNPGRAKRRLQERALSVTMIVARDSKSHEIREIRRRSAARMVRRP